VYRRQDLLRHERIEHDMNQGFLNMTSTMEGQLCTVTQRVQEVRDGVSSGQARVEEASSRYREHAASVQKHIVSANKDVAKPHNKTRHRIAQGNTMVIDTFCLKLQELPGHFSQTQRSARKSSREIRFNGQSRETMLTLLLLLKPGFRSAILNTISHTVTKHWHTVFIGSNRSLRTLHRRHFKRLQLSHSAPRRPRLMTGFIRRV
jgi:hypothetical protein